VLAVAPTPKNGDNPVGEMTDDREVDRWCAVCYRFGRPKVLQLSSKLGSSADDADGEQLQSEM